MHDSVAHHLTVIVALSYGALRAVTRAPADAADAIADVSATARQALAETRRLLGVLRTEAGQEPRQPLPGMADLDDLLCRARAAGLPVHYECSGTSPDPPRAIQLAVFRLVQEALTNTMKHAGRGASAAVRLQLTPAEVHVDVEDDGAGRGAVPGAAGGGLTGMRERISAFGGDLDFGPPAKVLILTTFELDDYVYTGLRAGASGFLLKDTQPDDLVAGIRTIASGDAVLSQGATKRLIRQFTAQQPRPPGGRSAHQIRQALTGREMDVFSLIATGMSNSEIAATLRLSEGTP
jgi:DNA-binding NarL/FixJ family response regulator